MSMTIGDPDQPADVQRLDRFEAVDVTERTESFVERTATVTK